MSQEHNAEEILDRILFPIVNESWYPSAKKELIASLLHSHTEELEQARRKTINQTAMNQLGDIFIMVIEGSMTSNDFVLAFRSRFPEEVTKA